MSNTDANPNDSILETDVLVCDVDWPLSLGVRLYARRVPKSDEQEGGFYKLNSREWLICIVDDYSNKARAIELIVHECCHAADGYFEQTVVTPCSELRAYTTDWLVGKTLMALEIV